jgi:hypothetical protein
MYHSRIVQHLQPDFSPDFGYRDHDPRVVYCQCAFEISYFFHGHVGCSSTDGFRTAFKGSRMNHHLSPALPAITPAQRMHAGLDRRQQF